MSGNIPVRTSTEDAPEEGPAPDRSTHDRGTPDDGAGSGRGGEPRTHDIDPDSPFSDVNRDDAVDEP